MLLHSIHHFSCQGTPRLAQAEDPFHGEWAHTSSYKRACPEEGIVIL